MGGAAARLAAVGLSGLLLAMPTSAAAVVTIGSNLARAPNEEVDCGESSCTLVQTALPSGSQAPGGVVSPVNGIVTRWRIRVGALTTTPTVLRVIRPLGGALFTGAGTSAGVMPQPNAVTTTLTALPISIGDQIGFQVPGTPLNYTIVDGGTTNRFQPVLADGGAGRSPGSSGERELALNADIEPTATFGSLEAKSKKGGKIKVTADLPNPGTLTAGDKAAKLVAAAGKKTKLLTSKTAQVAAPGQVTLTVKATKAARSILADAGKLKAKLKIAFTPTGGTASTQVKKVKLKP